MALGGSQILQDSSRELLVGRAPHKASRLTAQVTDIARFGIHG